MSHLYIYRSSAGSGKTHTLVSTYIQLALKSPNNFKRILAVTFTNQATQEMKQRIITSLYNIVVGTETMLTKEFLETNGWTKNVLQERAKNVLNGILHQYDHFNVSTIDSFLQNVVRNFSKELGIQYGFSIEMDLDSTLEQAVEEVINLSNNNAQLRGWLIKFAQHKLLSGKTWQLNQTIKQLGYELFTENFNTQETELIKVINDPNKLSDFLTSIKKCITEFESRLQELSKKSIIYIQEAGLNLSDFAYGERGIAGYLLGLSTKNNFKPTQRALAALNNIDKWYTKSHPKKTYIFKVIQEKLHPILEEIIEYYNTQHTIYYTALAIQQYIYELGIITHLLSTLRDIRSTKNILLISDVSNLLRQIIAENDTPFIYEKIGSFYNHLLIDEFQDISNFQWQNLKPLIKNGLATGHMSLVVGDVKQSIYRWRGSNWKLLSDQIEQEFAYTKNFVLDRNWRSKPNIIYFNNTFFTQATEKLIRSLGEEIHKLSNDFLKERLIVKIQELQKVYEQAYQHITPIQQHLDPGYVEINFLEDITENDKTISWKEQVKKRLPALLETLQQDGYSLQDIALLVRNHTEARELFQTFMNYKYSSNAKSDYNYDTLTTESLYLGSNPWINIIISALYYLENDTDILAKTELIYLYQTYVVKNKDNPDFFQYNLNFIEKPEAYLPSRFIIEFSTLLNLTLYERIIRLIDIFQLKTPVSTTFIYAFEDLILSYIQTNNGTIYQFLKWWDEKGNKYSLPRIEIQDAMRIMTIHQAKGLEFKVVIIPFCNWELDHNSYHPPIMWCTSEKQPFATFPVLPIRYHTNLQDTIYAETYYEEHIQVYLDNLNLLYVAFTRAKEKLYTFSKKPNLKKNKIESMSDLVYESIQSSPETTLNNFKRFLNWKEYWQENTQQLVIGIPAPLQT